MTLLVIMIKRDQDGSTFETAGKDWILDDIVAGIYTRISLSNY